MKKYIKVSLVLGIIALICAALIAVMNMVTSPVISKNEEKTKLETYSKVFEDYDHNIDVTKDVTDASGYITAKIEAYDKDDNFLGYIYTTDGKNAYGEISLMIGIKDGKVYDVEFLTNTESFASTVNSHVKSSYPSSEESVIEISPYKTEESPDVDPMDSDSVDGVDVHCGATYGATLVNSEVKAALAEAEGVR